MDQKMKNCLKNLFLIRNYPGLKESRMKADRIEVQRQRMVSIVGEEKAAEVFERIKNAAYKQHTDNGSYILGMLHSINAKLQSGEFEYVKPGISL